MNISAEDFLKKAGLDEPLAPGQIKFKQHIGEKAANTYTVVYDWKTDPNKIRVEVRAGLTGQMPMRTDLGKFAVWLQAENFLELDMSGKKPTKH